MGWPRWVTGLLAALMLVAGLTACAGDPKDQPTTLPPITATPTPTASPSASPTPLNTAGMSDEQQVRAVYVDLKRNYYYFANGATYQDRKRAFSRWAIGGALRSYSHGDDLRKHQRYRGSAVAYIVKVQVESGVATVYDCSDESRVTLQDTRSGRVISRGRSHIRVVARLKKTVRGWRVFTSGTEEGRCERT